VLNGVVLLWCGWKILLHPELFSHWHAALFSTHADWTAIFIASALVFPKLALASADLRRCLRDAVGVGAGPEKARKQFPAASLRRGSCW